MAGACEWGRTGRGRARHVCARDASQSTIARVPDRMTIKGHKVWKHAPLQHRETAPSKLSGVRNPWPLQSPLASYHQWQHGA